MNKENRYTFPLKRVGCEMLITRCWRIFLNKLCLAGVFVRTLWICSVKFRTHTHTLFQDHVEVCPHSFL